MIKAGFIAGANDRIVNPWERGGAFKKMLKEQKGSKYKMPTGGTTVGIHAPSKHTLFVNYCKDCVGMMALVYQWNHEVEDALQVSPTAVPHCCACRLYCVADVTYFCAV